MAVQEHRLRSNALATVSQSLQGQGWNAALAEAKCTGEVQGIEESRRTSAGIGVCAPTSVGFQIPWGLESWDASLAGQEGRIALAWCDLLGGIVVVSAYCWCSENWFARNIKLMDHVASILVKLEAPWVLAADFQHGTQHLRERLLV